MTGRRCFSVFLMERLPRMRSRPPTGWRCALYDRKMLASQHHEVQASDDIPQPVGIYAVIIGRMPTKLGIRGCLRGLVRSPIGTAQPDLTSIANGVEANLSTSGGGNWRDITPGFIYQSNMSRGGRHVPQPKCYPPV